ncbi:MAG: helix-turn-helix domain-containing protein [Elusimicrobia bacterium]|nr:helix-turn-helix domain-containing protein [Elusimicrobiota bacterium]
MDSVKKARQRQALSQRNLAKLAGLSFRSIQLIESPSHDPRISSLQRLGNALGLPAGLIERRLAGLFSLSPDSVAIASERILTEGGDSWKTCLFDFVDAFRRAKDRALIEAPPAEETPPRAKALLASTTEALCSEEGLAVPSWCAAVESLSEPWFVSGVDNLKASALAESPAHFRKRGIFVLGNFLQRA